jgi:hypothetical protein
VLHLCLPIFFSCSLVWIVFSFGLPHRRLSARLAFLAVWMEPSPPLAAGATATSTVVVGLIVVEAVVMAGLWWPLFLDRACILHRCRLRSPLLVHPLALRLSSLTAGQLLLLPMLVGSVTTGACLRSDRIGAHEDSLFGERSWLDLFFY